MSEEKIITIDLPAAYTAGKETTENLHVQKLGKNHYRLLKSPGFVPGLAAQDEFELTDENLAGYRLLKRSKNVCVQLFTSYGERCQNEIVPLAQHIGGTWDGFFASETIAGLVFTFPISVGFQVIEELMEKAKSIDNELEWYYGNVYDSKDGITPLNWWL